MTETRDPWADVANMKVLRPVLAMEAPMNWQYRHQGEWRRVVGTVYKRETGRVILNLEGSLNVELDGREEIEVLGPARPATVGADEPDELCTDCSLKPRIPDNHLDLCERCHEVYCNRFDEEVAGEL